VEIVQTFTHTFEVKALVIRDAQGVPFTLSPAQTKSVTYQAGKRLRFTAKKDAKHFVYRHGNERARYIGNLPIS
jgi:hypothetical protein